MKEDIKGPPVNDRFEGIQPPCGFVGCVRESVEVFLIRTHSPGGGFFRSITGACRDHVGDLRVAISKSKKLPSWVEGR